VAIAATNVMETISSMSVKPAREKGDSLLCPLT
jgi:hypothetical protein